MKGDIEFDIDTWPQLNPYLEIEAPSWGKIDEAIKMLGLNIKDKKINGRQDDQKNNNQMGGPVILHKKCL